MFRGLFQTKNKTKNNIVMHTEDLDMQNIPQHIAIIMDGNGRWAKAQGKVRTFGHQAGAETLKTIVHAADKLGVKVISAYAFSTENWKRPVTEVNFIMELLSRYLTNEIDEFNENNVQVRFIGSRKGLPEIVQQKMEHAIEATKNNTGIILNLAINYGGQAEILHAVRTIAAEAANGTLAVDDIDNNVIENHCIPRACLRRICLSVRVVICVSATFCSGRLLMRKSGRPRCSGRSLHRIIWWRRFWLIRGASAVSAA